MHCRRERASVHDLNHDLPRFPMDIRDSLVTRETERELEIIEDALDNRLDACLTSDREPIGESAAH